MAGVERAAGELSVTQGAVSHQVKALEAELGIRLFLRERQGLALTEAGRTYLEVVRDAFARIADGTQKLLRRQRSGVLSWIVQSAVLSQVGTLITL